MQDVQFIHHHRRIRVGLDALMKSFYAGEHPFTSGVMEFPQEDKRMPADLPRGGLTEANYWMWICHYMLGAADSMTMAQLVATSLYPNNPELFDWKLLAQMQPAEVSRRLKKAGLGFRASEEEIPAAAIENAIRTNARWDGDIRNAFKAAGTDWKKLYRLLIATKRGGGLVGYRGKMASMLAYYYMRRGIIPYFPMPPQVDFHVMRVFWACNFVVPIRSDGQGVYVLKNHMVTRYTEAIKPYLFAYIKETGCNWLDLSDALWTQSRTMCKLAPSNSMTRDENEEPYQRPIKWTPNQVKRHESSCGRCALANHCSNAIPQAPYYGRAATRLVLWGPRQEPPFSTQSLF